jgi:hypothetical protein
MKTPALFPKDLRARLIANGEQGRELDHVPVVKIMDPLGPGTWLITELRPDDPDVFYGLIFDPSEERGPCLGYHRLSVLQAKKGTMGEPLERDPAFAPRYPVSVYKVAARIIGRVSEDIETLYLVATNLGIRPVGPLPNSAAPKRNRAKSPARKPRSTP